MDTARLPYTPLITQTSPGLSSTAVTTRAYSPWTDRVVWAVVVLALLFRVGYNLALHSNGHGPANFIEDEREYFGAAHILAEGRGFSFFDTALWVRPPLYVMFLAPFASSDTTAAMIVQSLLSAATLLPLAVIGARLGGRKAARWTALLGALYLPFTLFAGLLLSETLFVFLFALAFVALLRASDALSVQLSSSRYLWPAVAGLLLGLSVLTRATALAFVPLAALWLLFSTRRVPARSRLASAGVLLGVSVLVLIPWIARNYAAYHRFILVDTTSGYNLWLASVGVRDEPRLQADLLKIPNPADRQAFAYQQAFENIRNDPGFFIRKGLKESLDLWQPLFGAEEHQISGYTLGRVPAWHLLGITVLDDWLYLAIMLLALVGLLFSRDWKVTALTLLWVGLWVAMSFVFFAVTRFRLPVVAILIPWAGFGATLLPTLWPRSRARERYSPRLIVLGAALALLILVVLVPGMVFTVQSGLLGAQRWAEQAPYREAEVLLRSGKPQEAIALYRQANTSVADTRYGLAAAYLETGDTKSALATLTKNEPADRFEPSLIRGEAARRSGDLGAAKSFFNERVVRLAGDDALQWAWNHMSPPATDSLQIGSGLDIGYIRGFHTPETGDGGMTYRWTTDAPEIRGVGPNGGPLSVLLSAWRPGGAAPARLSALDATGKEGSFQPIPLPGATWVTAALPAQPSGATEKLKVNPFVPGGSDPRLLGIQVSSVGTQK